MQTYFGIGNLTRDPDLRTTPTGKSVCRFTIAINGVKTKNNDQPRVDYVPCVCWDQQAENAAKYLTKGRTVAIKGKLKSGSYDKKGEKHYTLEVELDRFDGLQYMYDRNREQQTEQTEMPIEGKKAEQVVDEYSGFTAVETDELPF